MSDLRTAAQQALEALDEADTYHRNQPDQRSRRLAAMAALRAALAQQAEPVQAAERERIASQWDGCVTHQLDAFGPVDIGASIRAGELVEAQQAEPVQEPVAKVELMTTGGNAGLATRIVEIDDHLRERLRPGQLLYTAPPRCPNCASLEAQNNELDRKLAEMEQAEPSQEPVAHFGSAYVNENGVHITTVLGPVAIPQDAKLYTAPPHCPNCASLKDDWK